MSANPFRLGGELMAVLLDTDSKSNADLIKVYDQLCESYRAIDDFRAKLLGFLPLASAGGAFLLLNDPEKITFAKPLLGPLGLFGFVVSLGLFFFEIYGIRKCHALINAGKKIECALGITDGPFLRRPGSVLYVINEPFAAGIIYPAVLAAWMFLIKVYPQPQTEQPPAIEAALMAAVWVFVAGFLVTVIYGVVLPMVDKPYECK